MRLLFAALLLLAASPVFAQAPTPNEDERLLASADVLEEVARAGGPLMREVRVVDRYDRPPVPPGQVSLTITLAYQDPTRTLTGEEVQASVEAVVAALRARGWDIRGE